MDGLDEFICLLHYETEQDDQYTARSFARRRLVDGVEVEAEGKFTRSPLV